MEEQESLSFGQSTQEQIFAWMLGDHTFFLQCIEQDLNYKYFTDPILSGLVKIVFDLHTEHKAQPTIEMVRARISAVHFDAKNSRLYHDMLNRTLIARDERTLDVIGEEMTGWKQMIIFKRSVTEAIKLHNSHRHKDAYRFLQSKIDEISQVSFLKDERVRFDDLEEWIPSVDQQFSDYSCTIGHPQFDDIITDYCTKPRHTWIPNQLASMTNGSLLPGDSTVLVGPSNAGKTTFCVTVAVENMIMKRHVLLMTLEHKSEDIKMKIAQCVTGLTIPQLKEIKNKNGPDYDGIKRAVGVVSYLAERYFHYQEYLKPGQMYSERVIAKIQALQEERISFRRDQRVKNREKMKGEGKWTDADEQIFIKEQIENRGYDLIIVDYPAKLQSEAFKGKQAKGYEEKAFIYKEFVELAQFYKLHGLYPVQTNREAYNLINRAKDSKNNRILDQGDVAEAFGIMAVAPVVITINRSADDVTNETITFGVAKSRGAITHRSFVSKTAFARGRTHGIGLPGFTSGYTQVSQQIKSQYVGESTRQLEAIKNDKSYNGHNPVIFTGEAAKNTGQSIGSVVGLPQDTIPAPKTGAADASKAQ